MQEPAQLRAIVSIFRILVTCIYLRSLCYISAVKRYGSAYVNGAKEVIKESNR